VTTQRAETVADDWGAPRSRVVTWHDPGPSTARGLTMTGLDYLRAMIDGTLPPPPICQLMRLDIVSAESGRVVFTCEPDESAYNGIGVVHGGLVCTLLDSVAALALLSLLPQGRGCTSVEIKVNYLRAVRLGSGLLTATGTVSRLVPGSPSQKALYRLPRGLWSLLPPARWPSSTYDLWQFDTSSAAANAWFTVHLTETAAR